ncbi:MAG: hypothetical protein ACRDYA_22965 [Egibacteraceae bacterium]
MSRMTHKPRILVVAVAVGSLMVLGLPSAAQAGEAGPVKPGLCVANIGNCGGEESSQDSE